MKKILLVLVLLVSFFTQVNAQWFNLNSPTNTYLYSTWFANYDTGYAVGGNINSSVFLKTTDGGANWGIITNTQTKWLYDVLFLNDTSGLACGYDGAMYKTTNAGASWTAKPSQTTAWLYAMAKKPDGTVFAVGQDGTIIKSTNAGDNWSPIVSNTIQTMFDVQFYDNNYGTAVGFAGEMVYTTDGGNNWAVKLTGSINSITGVWMLSPDTIWTCGFSGELFKTTNAGQNFALIEPTIYDFNAIIFTDDLNGYVAGQQEIFQTTDGGGSWIEMYYPNANGMKDIFVTTDDRVMYAVGDNGAIIKNVNTIGIENWGEEMVFLYPNPSSGIIYLGLEGNYDVLLMDINGRILHEWSLVEADNGKMDISDLSDGQYILRFTKAGKNSFGRIVVKH